jgi:simple sugar transport system substrate-binding protein
VVELQGAPGADPSIDRGTGFRNVIDQHDGIEIILSQTGQWNRLQGKEVMEAFLQAEGDNIDAVYAHNDDMAIGAIQAIEEYGLEPAEDIYIISIDAVRDAFVAMLEGDLNCTVSSSPLMGPLGFDALEAVWAGEELPEWIVVPDEKYCMDEVTQEVVDNRPY